MNSDSRWPVYRRPFVVCAVCTIGLVFGFGRLAPGQELLDQVGTILHDDSIRYDYKIERLAELGSAAVPALVHCLEDSDKSTQLAVIHSLERIGDKRATLPLVSVLDRSNAHVVLPALLAIADPRAESGFLRIMTSDAERVVCRILAAQGLARFGSETAKSSASAFLFDKEALMRVHEGQICENNYRFPYIAWGEALIELGSDEALQRVVDMVNGGGLCSEQVDLIKMLAAVREPPEVVIDGLFKTSANEAHETNVRFVALDALIGYGDHVSRARLLQGIEAARPAAEQMDEHYVGWLNRLKAKAMKDGGDGAEPAR